jgi:arsenate reductase
MVLFLSTGNAARSIIAEALLRRKAGERFIARSAGLQPLPHVHPHTLALLAAENVPADGLHSKGWGEFLASARILPIDVIVTLSDSARRECPPWPNNPVRVDWPLDNPLSASKPDVMEWKFRKAFAMMQSRVDALVKSRIAQSPSELLLQFKDVGMVV